jgi:hypothetical protein
MLAKALDGWQPRTRGELGDEFPLLEEHAVHKNDDRLHMLVRQCWISVPACGAMWRY